MLQVSRAVTPFQILRSIVIGNAIEMIDLQAFVVPWHKSHTDQSVDQETEPLAVSAQFDAQISFRIFDGGQYFPIILQGSHSAFVGDLVFFMAWNQLPYFVCVG